MLSPRRLVQLGFLLLVVAAVFLVRANAEAWCPFGGVETLYAWIDGGSAICATGVSNFFVLGAVLVSLVLLRRVFCSHACPIGTVSEWVNDGSRRLGLKSLRVPRGLDAALSLLKYAILVLIIWLTWQASELVFRTACPAYALLGRHGEDITFWAYVVSGAIVVLSLFFTMPFCRWLCPLAAVMNPLSRLGLARIRRDPASCIDCGKCARACPMEIPVDRVDEVGHARCTACRTCVTACPIHADTPTLALTAPGRKRRVLSGGFVALVFLAIVGAAVAAAYLIPFPSFRWSRGDLPADTASLDLEVEDLICRGTAVSFVYFLDRDDDLAVEGPLRVEAWPGPGTARVVVYYDPAKTSPAAIQEALTAAYFDYDAGFFRFASWRIPGYDPLGLGAD